MMLVHGGGRGEGGAVGGGVRGKSVSYGADCWLYGINLSRRGGQGQCHDIQLATVSVFVSRLCVGATCRLMLFSSFNFA